MLTYGEAGAPTFDEILTESLSLLYEKHHFFSGIDRNIDDHDLGLRSFQKRNSVRMCGQ